MTDTDLDYSEWIPYDDFAEERYEQMQEMLEHFNVPGPGPPLGLEEPPDFFPPPPPIPGTRDQCVEFSLYFDSCDNTKASSIALEIHLFPCTVMFLLHCLYKVNFLRDNF